MSWNISTEGSRDDVQEVILGRAEIPDGVKSAVGELLLTFGEGRSYALIVRGHFDAKHETGNVTITLEVL